jgi:PAT family beta-lactamase induction signal transducer AmpG
MMNPFFVDLGFSGVEIASVTKVLGLAATVVGIAVGGVLIARMAVIHALALGGLLQAVTNLLFAWLAGRGNDTGALALAVVGDSFTGGVASAAFVAYFSSLARGPFSATQYALLVSLMATGRTFFAGGSGWVAAQTDWATFFVATAALALPGLALLLILPDPRRSPLPDSEPPGR